MIAPRVLLISLPLLVTLATATAPSPPLSTPLSTSDGYLWQRSGNAAAVGAFARFSSGRLHVLMFDDQPRFARGDDVVVAALRTTTSPVVATVRLQSLDDDRLDAAVDVVKRARGFGVSVVELEVDHDCGTAALAGYAAWLKQLRVRLHKAGLDVNVGITALPAWLDDDDHRAVFAAADDVTLQVHAVAKNTLVDVDAALAAVTRARAERDDVRVALPTYALTLKDGTQLHADVDDLRRLVGVTRVTWFRLPSPERDAWGWRTLRALDPPRALDAAQALTRGVSLVTLNNDDGSQSLRLKNTGSTDEAAFCVAVDGAAAFDAFAGFVVDGCALCPASARFIAPGEEVAVGWARAAPASASASSSSAPSAPGALHASLVTAAAPVGRRHRCG